MKSARGHMVFSKPCLQCGGSGRQRQTQCPACGGQQFEMRTEAISVNVPPGLADGARIRVPGKGHAGRNGGEAGDLYLTVHVQPHPLFRRDGDDLHLTCRSRSTRPRSAPRSTCRRSMGSRGCACRPARSPGSGSGSASTARRRPRDGHRGDLVVEVRLVLPALLDERSKELLREFGRINSDDVDSR